jgi:hypothetical protein
MDAAAAVARKTFAGLGPEGTVRKPVAAANDTAANDIAATADSALRPVTAIAAAMQVPTAAISTWMLGCPVRLAHNASEARIAAQTQVNAGMN